MKEIIFVIGGCRSGKSRQALETADGFPGDKRVFIATCIPRDEEMRLRVDQHQKERSQNWQTVEAPEHLPQIIVEHSRQANVLLVDCLPELSPKINLRDGSEISWVPPTRPLPSMPTG